MLGLYYLVIYHYLQYIFQTDAIFDIRISQGSVATRLRHGGIFKHEFVANLRSSPSVKKFGNRLIFGEVMGKSLVSCFLTHSVNVFLKQSYDAVGEISGDIERRAGPSATADT